MARNSDQLCAALLQHGALEALCSIAFCTTDNGETPQRRIALFSLGTICSFDICRAALLHNQGPTIYTVIEDLEAQSIDKYLSRYASRLRMKLTR
jgi:hypothetical protein